MLKEIERERERICQHIKLCLCYRKEETEHGTRNQKGKHDEQFMRAMRGIHHGSCVNRVRVCVCVSGARIQYQINMIRFLLHWNIHCALHKQMNIKKYLPIGKMTTTTKTTKKKMIIQMNFKISGCLELRFFLKCVYDVRDRSSNFSFCLILCLAVLSPKCFCQYLSKCVHFKKTEEETKS